MLFLCRNFSAVPMIWEILMKKILIFDLICHKFKKISKSIEIIIFSYEHHSKISKNTRKIGKNVKFLTKNGKKIFHMRDDLLSKNFGLQQKYSQIEDFDKLI